MRTRMLLDSTKYGVTAAVLAFSLEAHADSRMQIATGQYVTPTAVTMRSSSF